MKKMNCKRQKAWIKVQQEPSESMEHSQTALRSNRMRNTFEFDIKSNSKRSDEDLAAVQLVHSTENDDPLRIEAQDFMNEAKETQKSIFPPIFTGKASKDPMSIFDPELDAMDEASVKDSNTKVLPASNSTPDGEKQFETNSQKSDKEARSSKLNTITQMHQTPIRNKLN